MKKLLFFIALAFVAYDVEAQCTSSGLIFSSYLEGDVNENCVGVYNGTGMPVDLGDYSVSIFYDGSATSTTSIPVGTTGTLLADMETYTICNDACATPNCTDADGYVSGLVFDGNDALVLVEGTVGIDTFGIVGEDLGGFWQTDDGLCTTEDHELIRDLSGTGTCSGTTMTSFDLDTWGIETCTDIVPLPVKLTAFQARATDNGNVLLNWTTESELNTKEFIIQDSHKGGKFEDVLTQSAIGQGNNTVNYSAIHENPRAGVHYYRLKIIDLDGSYTFSDVRSVEIEGADIAVAPNPANNYIDVDFNNLTSDMNLRVMDVSGKLIKELTVSAAQTNVQLDLTDFTPGHYFIRTVSGSDIKVFRFLKI